MADKKIILTADSTCDLGAELKQRYNVEAFQPMHITLDGKSYDDSINIFPDQVYERFYKDGTLPRTAAVSIGEYEDFFRTFVDKGCEVIHINLGSALSASHSNARLAAESLEGVYVIDSQNLSTGTGLIVIEAAERIAKGMPAAQIAEELKEITSKAHASFVLDTLKFLAAGGRCSAVAAFGANVLGIKPSIEVDNTKGGAMGVGKKYRGKFEKCVLDYVNDQLAKYGDTIEGDHIFITHSGVDQKIIDSVQAELKKTKKFKEIFVTRASCTISCHCGPGCLGILFMTK